MISEEKLKEIHNTLEELDNMHLLAGSIYQKVNSCKALLNLNNDDAEVVYDLMETHCPGLRHKTVYRYEKLLWKESSLIQNMAQLEISKEILNTKCSAYPKANKVEQMLCQIKEMPKEWTVVQLTPQFNPQEIWNENNDIYYTNSIHISVSNCGKKEAPFFVTVNAPRDSVNGQIVELAKELVSILKLNTKQLTSFGPIKTFKNLKERNDYLASMQAVEDRLVLLIKDMQNLWLKEWRCLLSGKFCDENLENQISVDLKSIVKAHGDLVLTKKVETILSCVVKNYIHLKYIEAKNIVDYCFPNTDPSVIKKITLAVRSLGQKIYVEHAKTKRHPVILIIHDSLDCFPWEMIDVLEEQPACRLPSFHFLYCLFKEHESDIVDGYKIIKDYEKGSYVVNPNLDLKAMENRMMLFFNYWTPHWIGTAGYEPSKDEFLELLTSSNIFSYNGHGSGSAYVPVDKLQKSHVKAVVLLFGCGSTRIARTDPQVEMFGHYHMYLIARCPCVVGMLWEVTDRNTDLLSTAFMSYWIPSKSKNHWQYVDKKKWSKEEKVVISKKQKPDFQDQLWEPNLLLALILAKKSSSSVLNKAACVVRGLPIKIEKQ